MNHLLHKVKKDDESARLQLVSIRENMLKAIANDDIILLDLLISGLLNNTCQECKKQKVTETAMYFAINHRSISSFRYLLSIPLATEVAFQIGIIGKVKKALGRAMHEEVIWRMFHTTQYNGKQETVASLIVERQLLLGIIPSCTKRNYLPSTYKVASAIMGVIQSQNLALWKQILPKLSPWHLSRLLAPVAREYPNYAWDLLAAIPNGLLLPGYFHPIDVDRIPSSMLIWIFIKLHRSDQLMWYNCWINSYPRKNGTIVIILANLLTRPGKYQIHDNSPEMTRARDILVKAIYSVPLTKESLAVYYEDIKVCLRFLTTVPSTARKSSLPG